MLRNSMCSAAVSAVLGLVSAIAAAQPPNAQAMQELQAKMKQHTSVGAQHAELGTFIGKWDVEIAFSGAAMPARRSKGTAEYSWLIDGRWLGQKIDAELFGQPYRSFSVIGYDTFAKNHVVATVASSSNSMSIVRGPGADPKQMTTPMFGTLDDFISGELHRTQKIVRRKIDNDHHVAEIWEFGPNDTATKVLEFTFTRKR